MGEGQSRQELYTEAESLQNLLVAQATGGHEDDTEYRRLRNKLRMEPTVLKQLPHFVQTCSTLAQFWQFVA